MKTKRVNIKTKYIKKKKEKKNLLKTKNGKSKNPFNKKYLKSNNL